MRRDATNILDAFSTARTIRRVARQFIKFHTHPRQGVSSADTAFPVTRVCKSVEDYARNTRDVFHGPTAENCDSSIALYSTDNNFLVRENGSEIGDDRIYRAFPIVKPREYFDTLFFFFFF